MTNAYAAKKDNTKKILITDQNSQIKYVVISTGEQIACMLNSKGVYIPGSVVVNKGETYHVPSEAKDKKQQKKKKTKAKNTSNKKKKKKFKSQAKKIGSLIKEKKSVCNGAEPQVPDDLTPFKGAPTEAQLNLLLDRLGFAPGRQDRFIVDLGLSQGLEAAVNSLFTLREQDAQTLQNMEDWTDGELDFSEGTHLDPSSNEKMEFYGMQRGILELLRKTVNPVHDKLFLFLANMWNVNESSADYYQRDELWEHLMRVRYHALYDPTIPGLANSLLQTNVMFRQHHANTNVNTGLNSAFAETILEYLLPGSTDGSGRPNFSESDLDAMTKVMSGYRITSLPDAFGDEQDFPVFNVGFHTSGNHSLFAGANPCVASDLDDYKACVFDKSGAGKSLARFYSRKLLEYYLYPDPPSELVGVFAEKIRANNWNLMESLKDLAKSAVFYSEAYVDSVPKSPIEAMIGWARILDIPVEIPDYNGLRDAVARAGQYITDPPSPEGYQTRDWTSTQVYYAIGNGLESIIDNDSYLDDNNWSWNVADGSDILPTQDEIFTDDLINYVLNKMGIPVDRVPQVVRERLEYYVKYHKQWNGDLERDLYDPQSESNQDSKGIGLYLTCSPLFMLK